MRRQLALSDPRHETTNGYTNLGCRCDRCRYAHAAAKRQQQARRVEQLRADPTVAEHARYSTYTNWGCRCGPCTDANTVYWRSKRADGAA